MKELDSGSSQKLPGDSHSTGDLELSHHSSALETDTSFPWEPMAESQEQARPAKPPTPDPVLGKALVKGLCYSQCMQWEVNFQLGPPGPEPNEDLWSETFHHLAARAIIRDFEQLAEQEDEIEQGSNRRYQANAVHISKACNVISKYTAFVPVDLNKRRYLPTVVKYPKSGATLKMVSFRSLARQWENPSAGSKQSQTMFREDASAAGDSRFQTLTLEERPPSSFDQILSARCEQATNGPPQSLSTGALTPLKAYETLFGSKLNLHTPKLLTRATKSFLSKSVTKALEPTTDIHGLNYIPLVSLQLASGAFLLNEAFSEAIRIPLEKLKWTSPFMCLRMSLTTRHQCFRPPSEAEADSEPSQELSALVEATGKLWATAVALGWLEHNSASYFTEWELVAAKASSWLEQQDVPEGRKPSTLKATARELFVLLRHWDENLEFNMLCYNPNYV